MIQSLFFLSSAKPASSPPLPSSQREKEGGLTNGLFPLSRTGEEEKTKKTPTKKGLMRNNGSRPLLSFPHRKIIIKNSLCDMQFGSPLE